VEARYCEVVTELLSLAAEATIRGNDYESPGFVLWETVGQNVYAAVGKAIEGVVPESEFRTIAAEADARAIGRIGGFDKP
jgi:hypothetical protein